ncbi:MAG: hydantoinase B/oxoprolinase family protein [Candidatus Leucobacter sulfamidivorax]|nr:hydantoinase B/oxoprolinase family protein [Candidatus Leucobacter sulfamidivorax]
MSTETRPTSGGDIIDWEIIRRKLESIAYAGAKTVTNLAHSRAIKEGRELSVAILDRKGDVVVIDDPLQLVNAAGAARGVLKRFAFDFRDGDAVLLNDPYLGGGRLHDFTIMVPYAFRDSLRGYIVVRAAMPDIGGDAPGSYVPTGREIWAEGVPIPPLKLYRFGKPQKDVMTSVLLNSRSGEEMRDNLDAMLAGVEIVQRRLNELYSANGAERMAASMAYTLDYAERRARARIENWSDGTFRAERATDHDGAGGPAVRIRMSVTVSGTDIAVDLSESDEATESFLNSTLSATEAAVARALFAVLGPGVPANTGSLRVLTVSCEEGRVANPSFPAAVNGGVVHLSGEIASGVAEAFEASADSGVGPVSAPRSLILARPETGEGNAVDLSAWAIAGCGGAAGRDGWGPAHLASRPERPSAEEWEIATEISVRRIEMLRDSAGVGQWRGSPGLEVVMDIPDDYVWTVSRDGETHTASGMRGGRAGSASALRLETAEGRPVDLGSVCVSKPVGPVRATLRFGGGGGYGDPKLRDRDALREDVVDGLLSADAAARDYGFELDEQTRAESTALAHANDDGRGVS